MWTRPEPSEYVDYYHPYISKIPDVEILESLEQQIETTSELLGRVPEDRAGEPYAPGKWSIKQVVGHLVDVERVFLVRALAFARKDPAHLPGIEQDDYVANANFETRRLRDIVEEFRAVRRSGLLMFRGFNEELATRRGIANGFEFSVRAIPWILAGHEVHHRTVIEERYLT